MRSDRIRIRFITKSDQLSMIDSFSKLETFKSNFIELLSLTTDEHRLLHSQVEESAFESIYILSET